jgi:hypothetical protein
VSVCQCTRANGQGWNWARILSTVLFVLATLQLRGAVTALEDDTRNDSVTMLNSTAEASKSTSPGRRICALS